MTDTISTRRNSLGQEVPSTISSGLNPESVRTYHDEDRTILDEAQTLVGGDRQHQYGHPGDDFTRTAGAWNALFGWDVTPAQVALAMIVVKLSRLEQTPHKRDSVVDIAGYARTYEMVMERDGGGLA